MERATPFAGQSVLVTGAASGIGRALAHRFGAAGARVGVLDIDAPGAEAVRAELAAAGVEALALPCDITSPEACEAAVAQVTAAFGGVDVLINNAGMSHHSLFADTDVKVLRRIMDVNFFGAVHCTQAALPSLRARRGAVVALSSVAGFAPLLRRTGYAASKHALHGLFDSLREELVGSGVAVLLVCPSFVDTAIDRSALAGDGTKLTGAKPVIGKLLSPEEVAAAVVAAVARRARGPLLLSPVAKASWWLSRVAPRAYSAIMRRKQG
jgi:NAD(P)-dependent dehydrogenase (short-subunit alcohol dehydrogenase family)